VVFYKKAGRRDTKKDCAAAWAIAELIPECQARHFKYFALAAVYVQKNPASGSAIAGPVNPGDGGKIVNSRSLYPI